MRRTGMRNLRTKFSSRNLRTTILLALFGCDSGLQRRHLMSQDSLRPCISSLSFRMKIILVTVACLTVAAITTTIASNPPTSNITVPSSTGQKVVINWTGSIPPLVNGASDCSKLADTPAVDQHVSTVNVPTGIYNSLNAKFTFNITWDEAAGNDEILTVIKPDGSTLASSDGGTPSETVFGNNLAGGAYKIVTCGFVSGPD